MHPQVEELAELDELVGGALSGGQTPAGSLVDERVAEEEVMRAGEIADPIKNDDDMEVVVVWKGLNQQ